MVLSLGLAQLMENDDPHRFFQRADEKPYQAEAGGKTGFVIGKKRRKIDFSESNDRCKTGLVRLFIAQNIGSSAFRLSPIQ